MRFTKAILTNYLMHNSSALYLLVLLCVGSLLLNSCSKSDDQREFENQGLTEPEGITETDNSGSIKNNDPDDWRISPMYQGLITIGSTGEDLHPHPNPLPFNLQLTIDLYIRTIETLNRIEIYSFEFPEEANSPAIAVREDISSPTLETFTLSGQLISGSTGGSQASGLYRILIYDGKQNLITYGDIKIGTE